MRNLAYLDPGQQAGERRSIYCRANRFDRFCGLLGCAAWTRSSTSVMTDPDLIRFLDAQDQIYSQVIEELTNGRKQTHWMWFIFP
jgi:Protein of unknown function (DUF1810)